MNPCSAELARREFFSQLPGTYWNPKLLIQEQSNGDRTVICAGDLQLGEPLGILTEDAVLSDAVARSASPALLADLNDRLVLPALVALHSSGHPLELPAHFPIYLKQLPTAAWYEQHHPIGRALAKLPAKAITGLAAALPLLQDYQELEAWAKTVSPSPNPSQLRRGLLAVSSRRWGVGLVPWIDFFNHDDEGSMLALAGPSITASRPYSAGQTVHINYGVRCGHELLSVYGFSTAAAPVALPRPPASAMACAMDPDLVDYNSALAHRPLLLREDYDINLLLAPFRVHCIDRLDLPWLHDIAAQHTRPINGDNEQRAAALLLAALEQEETRLAERRQTLQRWGAEPLADLIAELERGCQRLQLMRSRVIEHWGTLLVPAAA